MNHFFLVLLILAAGLVPLLIWRLAGAREKRFCAELLQAEKSKEYAEAIRIARKLIGIRSRFAAYYADLARIQEKAGQLKAARSTLHEMLEGSLFSPSFGKETVSEHIIRLSFLLKDYPEAFRNSWILRHNRPENVTALIGVGRIYAGQGRLEEAEQAFQEAVRLSPDNAEVRSYCGLCSLDRGDSGKALPHLERAFQVNPSDTNIVYFLALLYQQIGRNDRAVSLFSRIGMSPESAPPKLLQAGLLSREMPRLDLDFIRERATGLKRTGRIRTVAELLGVSGEELHEIVLGMLKKMKLSVREELKDSTFDASVEKRFLCRNVHGAVVLAVFVKTKSELGPIPLTEIQNQMEARGAAKGILFLTSELSAAAKNYAEKDASLTVIDRTRLERCL